MIRLAVAFALLTACVESAPAPALDSAVVAHSCVDVCPNEMLTRDDAGETCGGGARCDLEPLCLQAYADDDLMECSYAGVSDLGNGTYAVHPTNNCRLLHADRTWTPCEMGPLIECAEAERRFHATVTCTHTSGCWATAMGTSIECHPE